MLWAPQLAAPFGSARTVAAVIGRGAVAIPFLIGPLPLASVLGGLVMADDAAGTRSEQPVVTGKMPCDTADNGALQAALGRRRGGIQRKTCHRDGKSRRDQYRFHVRLLETGCDLLANSPCQPGVPAITADLI